jgi:hypothetical protein
VGRGTGSASSKRAAVAWDCVGSKRGERRRAAAWAPPAGAVAGVPWRGLRGLEAGDRRAAVAWGRARRAAGGRGGVPWRGLRELEAGELSLGTSAATAA